MRDPDLVVRAQRAAAELERAWDRWRTMHGLGTDPLPPVSSYVGYSLQEPWGQPRVVFGIDAGEAEQLAALLDRHDCAGPVYAAVASMAGARTGDADTGQRNGGRVRVPTQAQPGLAQREKPADTIRPDPLFGPLEPSPHRDGGPRNGAPGNGAPGDGAPGDGGPRDGGPRDGGPRNGAPLDGAPGDGGPREGGPLDGAPGNGAPRDGGPRSGEPRAGAPRGGAPLDGGSRNEEPGTGVAAAVVQEGGADHEAPAPGDGQRPDGAQPGPAGPVAFRPRLDPAAYSGEAQEPAPLPDEPGKTAEPGPAPAGWTRTNRAPGGHALPRQKRAGGAAKGASSK